MKEGVLVYQRELAVVFWENVERYMKEANKTHVTSSRELDLPANFFSSYKKRKEIPKAKHIEKLCQYLDLQYVDLFEDWG